MTDLKPMPNFCVFVLFFTGSAGALVASAQALRAAPQLRPQTNPGVATQTGADYGRPGQFRAHHQPGGAHAPVGRTKPHAQWISLATTPELARQVLNNLIDERAQLQLAQESGIKIDDSTVELLAMQNVARQTA